MLNTKRWKWVMLYPYQRFKYERDWWAESAKSLKNNETC